MTRNGFSSDKVAYEGEREEKEKVEKRKRNCKCEIEFRSAPGRGPFEFRKSSEGERKVKIYSLLNLHRIGSTKK